MGSENVTLMTRLFADAIGGDWEERRKFVSKLFERKGNGNGGSPAGGRERSNSSRSSVIRAQREQAATYFGGSLRISAPWDLWEDRDFTAIIDRENPVHVGSIVSVAEGRMLRPAEPTSSTTRLRRPVVGIVQERDGWWARIRSYGPSFVRMDTDKWEANYHWGTEDTIWLSEKQAGTGSCRIPTTARKDIVLVGHRIGAMRNGTVEAFIRPAIYPATWWRVWEHDARNYIDAEHIGIRGGLWRIVFVVGGRTAAIADERRLVLRGAVTENEYTSDTQDGASDSNNGEMEWEGNSSLDPAVAALCFQVPHQVSGTYTRIAELNANGDLLAGQVVEGGFPLTAALSNDFSGPFYAQSSGKLDLSVDRTRTLIRCERYSAGGDPVNAYFEVNEIVEAGIV